MATVSLLVGSVTGTALATAQAMQGRLNALGHCVELIVDGRWPQEVGPWLICTSTTGAGDIPPNLMPFYQHLLQGQYLPGQLFSVITLGDSAYTNFAQSGRDIFTALMDSTAKPVTDIFIIDAIYSSDPIAEAIDWLNSWVTLLDA